MTFVKICGITNLEDALACVGAGADALGFNFYRLSSRYIDPYVARQVIEQLPPGILTVGVFVNEPTPADVERIAIQAGVGAVQLHGDETPSFCAALKGRQVIKALRITTDFDPSTALRYDVDAIMVDAFDRQLRGGTGKVVDWSIARRTRDLVPRLFLAGGLSPDNVKDAILAVEPYGIDSCSALENTPGKKDAAAVQSFLAAVRDAC